MFESAEIETTKGETNMSPALRNQWEEVYRAGFRAALIAIATAYD